MIQKHTYNLFTALLLQLTCFSSLHAQHLKKLYEGNQISIRGMAVVNDSMAWLSGSKGTVALTQDGGKTWQWQTIRDYEKLDFRSIAAFSDRVALVVSAGSPAVILRTVDKGSSWTKVYEDARDSIFLDGISFWNDSMGLAFGDPIGGLMQLLRTNDGGQTWSDISEEAAVKLQKGEAGFAASGSGIRTLGDGSVWIGTGGSKARVWYSYNYGQSWTPYDVPIEQGTSSQGIFSIALTADKKVIAAGGDYSKEKNNNNVMQLSTNNSVWKAPKTRLSGFKSSVEVIGNTQQVIVTGTSGTDFSLDGGETWKTISDVSLNVVRAAPSGKWVLLAGGDGRIYRLLIP